MPIGEVKVRRLTGVLLAAAVVATRLPFISRKLYEFDSVDFAVATFRFSLEQVTPHFPGYILHILFAKVLLLFTRDVNLAFVLVSIILSIGSVLFLWRAGAALRGERVGFMTAVIWLVTPIFWFYGEVATSYMYEALFACAFLYFGISLLRTPEKKWLVYLFFIAISLATGARQSSVIFFTPCLVYVLLKTRQPLRVWGSGFLLFLAISAVWLAILFDFSGGIRAYFAHAGNEVVYRSQSVLFGNSIRVHAEVIAKVFLYLIASALSFIIILKVSLILHWKRTIHFIKSQLQKSTFQLTTLVAMPPFLFYIGIYFIKAGYLLNILPSLALVSGVLLDQMAIWRAERIKKASSDPLRLTRPLITRSAIIGVTLVVAFDLFIFCAPFPWLCEKYIDNAFSFDSFNNQASMLDPKIGGGRGLFLNRLFAFNSIRGVFLTDELHSEVEAAIKVESANPQNLVILGTWWHRWGYYYLPTTTIYDIRDFPLGDSLWVGRSENYVREGISDSVIRIPNQKKMLIFIRHDNPSFPGIAKQVHLERLLLPEYLDIYRITDEHFSFRWKNVRFVRD